MLRACNLAVSGQSRYVDLEVGSDRSLANYLMPLLMLIAVTRCENLWISTCVPKARALHVVKRLYQHGISGRIEVHAEPKSIIIPERQDGESVPLGRCAENISHYEPCSLKFVSEGSFG